MDRRRRNIQELLNTIDDNRELGEIALDVADERGVIRAEFFNSRTSPNVFNREGFPELQNDEISVDDIRHANFVEHITTNYKW